MLSPHQIRTEKLFVQTRLVAINVPCAAKRISVLKQMQLDSELVYYEF